MICGAKIRSLGICKKHGLMNGRCQSRSGFSPKRQDQCNAKEKLFENNLNVKNNLYHNQIKLCAAIINTLGKIVSKPRKKSNSKNKN